MFSSPLLLKVKISQFIRLIDISQGITLTSLMTKDDFIDIGTGKTLWWKVWWKTLNGWKTEGLIGESVCLSTCPFLIFAIYHCKKSLNGPPNPVNERNSLYSYLYNMIN